MSAELVLLRTPWGLIGGHRDQVKLSPGHPTELELITVPLLFSFDNKPVEIDGSIHRSEPHASFLTRKRERQYVYAIPLPLKPEPQLIRHAAWREPARLQWTNVQARPTKTRDTAADGTPEAGQPYLDFLYTIIGRMQDIDELLRDCEDLWRDLYSRWTSEAEPRDPEMDLLVRHARQHARRWPDIVERPRRLLNRTREMLPLDRVQELDTRCMEWLSQQPGETLAERAGDRQRILALARHDNPNTLENRILRDLLERTNAAAREYLARQGEKRPTERSQLVRRYGKECRRLGLDLRNQGVMSPPPHPQPNYVLQQDTRYKHVWRAWQEILRRKRETDELWRWQHRAWAEMCKAAVIVGLYNGGARDLIAASPLKYRLEARHGQWLLHDDPIAIVDDQDNDLAIEILDGIAPDGRHRDIANQCPEFAASFWLRIGQLSGEYLQYVPVWAVHSFPSDATLETLVESANRTLDRSAQFRLPVRKGIVLQSLVDPGESASTQSAERVVGVRFGPTVPQLAEGLGYIAEELPELLANQP